MRLIETVRNGTGLYTVREAASYARMPTATLSAWLYGTTGHSPLRKSQIEREQGRYLTFLEFAEAVAIRSFRVNYAVSLPKIRQAIDVAKKDYGIEYPFANRRHRTYVIGQDLHIVLAGENDPIQLSGRMVGQEGMTVCLQQYMHDFEWDAADSLKAYVAYRHPVNGQRIINVKMNPAICFGAPLVGDTGYTAETLWRAALAEGSEQKTAEYYEVEREAVVAACRYCEEIRLAA